MSWNDILEALGWEKRRIFLSCQVSGTYKGEKLDIIFDYNNKDITINIPFITNFCFSIDREINNSDIKLKISSNNKVLLDEFLGKPENKDILDRIFKNNVKYLYVDGTKINFCISLPKIKSKEDYAFIKDICDLVVNLKGYLKKYELSKDTSLVSLPKYKYYLFIIIPIISIIIELFFYTYLLVISKKDFNVFRPQELFLKGFILFLPVSVSYLYLFWNFIKKSGYSYKKFSTMFSIVMIWFLASLPFIMAVNGYFDKSKTLSFEFNIVGKRPTENSFLVFLDASNNEVINFKGNFYDITKLLTFLEKDRISVTSQDYFRIVPGKTKIRVFLKKGLFDIKWIEKYTIVF